MKRRILSIVCALALCLGMLPATAWAANTPVTYLTWDETKGELVEATCDTYTSVSSSSWGSADSTEESWYVLTGNKNFKSRIEVAGDVHLILSNNCTLTAEEGIHVSQGSSLTIYAQSEEENQMGALVAQAGDEFSIYYGCAVIGGNGDDTAGSITINGGKITSTTKDAGGYGGYGAAIGTGSDPQQTERESTMVITINGGIVTAEANGGGAAIGTGHRTGGGTITIHGGTINATSNGGGAAIGTGYYGTGGTISISGGIVDTSSNNGAPAIGAGKSAALGTVNISGGQITAAALNGRKASESGAVIGCGYFYKRGGTINISGGTINITDGYENGIGYGQILTGDTTPSMTIKITGGSIRNPYKITTTPVNESGSPVYQTLVDLKGILNISANQKISGTITGYVDYGFNDVYTDDDTCLYLYLPAGETTATFAEKEFTGTVTAGSGNVLNSTEDKKDLVEFIDASGQENATAYYTPVASNTTSWSTGWYVVNSNVEISDRIEVSGNVSLILTDGATLTASGGIHVPDTTSLTIYRQSGGTGKLAATGADGNAGIGGNSGAGQATGIITIYGGVIEATGGSTGGAGIGGGADCYNGTDTRGTVAIYGGTVTATGGTGGAGIGTGKDGQIGSIVLAGGTIEANGGGDSAQDIGMGGGTSAMNSIMEFDAGHEGEGDGGTIVYQASSRAVNRRYDLDIRGGNIYTSSGTEATTAPDPYNGNYGGLDVDNKIVYYAVADLGADYANQPVSGTLTVDGSDYQYSFRDVKTDANGKLHLYTFGGSVVLTTDSARFSGAIGEDAHELNPVMGGSISIDGTAQYGELLTVNTSNVTPASAQEDLTYTWYRCTDSSGTGETKIEGATGSTYTLSDGDTGCYIKVVATSSEGYTLSAMTEQVQKAPSKVTKAPTAVTGLVYGGRYQRNYLINAGEAEGGTLMYSTYEDKYYASSRPSVSDAGTYTVWYYVKGDENHSDSEKYYIEGITVAPATLTVTGATVTNRVYDGTTAVELTGLSYEGLQQGDSSSWIDSSLYLGNATAAADSADAGTYDTVTLGGTITLRDSNYTLVILDEPVPANDKAGVTISPAEISIKSATVQDKTYDGSTVATVTDVTFTGLVNEESLTLDTDYTASAEFSDKNAGKNKSANITVNLKEDGNYTFGTGDNTTTATASIAPLLVVLEWGTTSFTYDGEEHSVTAEVTNKVGGDTVELTYSDNTATAVGSYTAAVTGLSGTDAANYTLVGCSNTQQTFTIAMAQPTVSNVVVSSPETIYDTTDISAITLTHGANDTSGTVALDAGQTLTVGERDYTWTFTPTDSTNYTTATGTIKLTVEEDVVKSIAVTTAPAKTTYTYGESLDLTGMVVTATYTSGATKVVTDEVTVTPKTLDTGVTALTIAYGKLTTTQTITVNPKVVSSATIELSGDSFEYTGSKIQPTVTVKDGDTVIPASEYTASYSNNISVGTATVTITDNDGGNYTVSGTATFQITKVKATVTEAPKANTLTYTGQPQTLVTAGTAEGGTMMYRLGESGEFSETIPTGTDAGNYSVWYYVKGDDNHSDTDPVSVDVTISGVDITGAEVTLNSYRFTYDGTAHKPAVTVTLGGMTLTEGTDYTVAFGGDTTNAGTVTVTVTGTGNYSGMAESKPTYTIEKATVTPSISDTASKTYDGTTAADGLSITLEGVVTGDTVTAAADSYIYDSANAGENKIITANGITLGGSSAGNYTLSATSATTTGTITPAALTVTANDQTKTYGDADPELTYQADGLIGNDMLTGELARAAGEDVGEYAITQGTLSNSNYTITFTGAKLTISARPVVLEWGTTSFTYDGSQHSVTATVTNVVGEDTFTLIYSGNTAIAVGSYIATVTGLGNANYTLDGAMNTSQEWNISEASIAGATVTLDKDSFTYDGREHKPAVTVTLGGKPLTENTDYTVTYDGDTTNAGTVTVTVTGRGSYSGEAAASYIILPAPLTITGATLAEKTYDGSTDAVVTSVTFREYTLTMGTDFTATAVYDSADAGTRSAAVTVTLNNGNFTLENSTYQLTNQTIAKADYDGGKEAFGAVRAAMPGSVDLPAIPAGASYGEPSGDAVTGLAISGNTLSYIGSGSIEKDQTYIITVPVNGGTNFNDYTITVTLTGDKKVPTGAPTLSADTITYGETLGTITLSGSMLDGEEAVTGTFTWDAPETVPDAGSYQAQWTFVPDNSDLYVSVKGSVEITVEKTTPTGAPQYTAITTSGKTLADAKLTTEGGTFSVEGAVAWELDDTAQVQANTAYKWIFTPADGDNYNSISGTVVLWRRSSNSGSSSSSTTETEKNPDGSTTTTVTKPDGTTTETTKWPDGSQEVIKTDKDGTVTTTTTDSGGNKTQVVENTDGSKETTVTNKDGSGSVTVVDTDGNIISQATLSEAAVEAAQAAGEAVALPMPAVPVTTDQENAPTVTVDLPSSGSAKVEVPVEDVTSGTVAVLVKDDGTEAVIKTSVTTENGVTATLSDGDTVKIVDNSKDFADVPDTYWGVEAVDFATSRELFVGTSAATFEPDTDMSRGMIVTVLARFEGVDTSSGDIWYEAGQQWAIGNGVSDGTNMDQILTREQLATMLWRYAGSPDVSGSLEGYTDADLVSDWAVQGMLWAVEQGIINGTTTTTLSPQNPATRAQAATILMRFIQGMV